MIPTGIGVGLTLPTMMATASSSLPPASFATGSAVVNMIRQIGLALGVAVLVAVLGTAAHHGLVRADRLPPRLVDHRRAGLRRHRARPGPDPPPGPPPRLTAPIGGTGPIRPGG